MTLDSIVFSFLSALCACISILWIMKGLVEQTARRKQQISYWVDITQYVGGVLFMWLAFWLIGGL